MSLTKRNQKWLFHTKHPLRVESMTELPVFRPAYHANVFPQLKLKLKIPESGINSHYIFRTDANHKRACPDCKKPSEPIDNMFLNWRLNHA